MIKIYLIAVTIFLTILTISISAFKPEINKPVRFATNNIEILNTELAATPNANNTIHPQTTIVNTELTENKTVTQSTIKINPQTQETTKVVKIDTPTKTTTKVIKKEVPPIKHKTITTETKPIKTKTETKKPVELPNSVKDIVNNTQKPPEKVVEVKPETKTPPVKLEEYPKQEVEQKPFEVPEENRPLTEQEEIIVWNTWRSNLQNKIMQDTQIYAPIGTAFKFSFTVDKRGRISNLRTWAIPSAYNSVAINYLKPLILSYSQTQNPILIFPARTKRVITNVTGGFVISTQDKFSTPNDFSDVEKIKTLR